MFSLLDNPAYRDDSLPHNHPVPTEVDTHPTTINMERRGSDSSEEYEISHRESRRRWAATEDRRDIQEMINALPSRQLGMIFLWTKSSTPDFVSPTKHSGT